MPGAHEIAEQLADHAEAVCRTFLPAGKKAGNYWQIGNVHGDAGASMWVRLSASGGRQPGRWTDEATGDYGDLLDVIAAQIGSGDMKLAMQEALEFLGEPSNVAPERKQTAPSKTSAKSNKPEAGKRLFSIGQPIAGTLAEVYLQGRAIERFGDALHYHPEVFFLDDDGETQDFPALLAAITDNDGVITGCARTWLNADTAGLALMEQPKRVLGRMHGNGVRFHAGVSPYDQIAGEGIETVLSVGTALPDADVVACLTANHLALYDPPRRVKRLWVAHDNDEAGERALAALKERAETEHFRVFSLPPIRNDHNDDLRAVGREIMANRLLQVIKSQVAGAFEPVF